MTQPESKPARPARRRTARILIGSGIAVVLVLAGSGVVYAATQNHADSYRTAVAKTGSIDSTMALSGSIAAASRRDVAFPVSGTVAGVAVSLGDTVTAGQKLATLDPTTLQAAVDTANQTVSDAEQKVQDDLDSQTATTTTASTGSASGFGDGQSNGGQNSGGRQSGGQDNAGQQSGGDQGGSQGNGQGGDGGGATPPTTTATPTPSPTATPEPDDAVQTAIDEVTAAQTALLAQYDTSAAALTTSTQAVGDSKSTCQPFLDAVSSGADSDDAAAAAAASASLDSLGGADAPAADSGDAGADASAPTDAELQQMLTDCQTAIDAALTAQTDTGTQQSALKDAADALDTAVKDLQTALADSASSSTTADTSSFTTGGMTVTAALATTALSATATTATATAAADATGGAYSGTTTTAATAAQIVADEAAITAAQAQVAIAKQQLTLATLTSPIAGTVMQVALAAGDEVSADSTTAVITVVADSGYVVSTTVDLARIGSLAVGQKATVTLPSDGSSHDGSVSSIGILDVSETSTPSYTVDISIAAGDTILIGASAEIVVSLASVDKVLTVPSSAVHVSGASTTVDRLVDGKSVATKMTIGAAGSETIEVTDGLSAGDVVILADLDQPMDSDSTDSSTGLTGLGGNGNGTGGGGAGGAGLTGGPGGGFGGQGGFTGGGPGGN